MVSFHSLMLRHRKAGSVVAPGQGPTFAHGRSEKRVWKPKVLKADGLAAFFDVPSVFKVQSVSWRVSQPASQSVSYS